MYHALHFCPGTVGTPVLPDPTKLLRATMVLLAAEPHSLPPKKAPKKEQ